MAVVYGDRRSGFRVLRGDVAREFLERTQREPRGWGTLDVKRGRPVTFLFMVSAGGEPILDTATDDICDEFLLAGIRRIIAGYIATGWPDGPAG